ncbi:MAG: aldo/keto reductase [Lachnoclostridium sp.]|nr:aldo/keto reductase [Lachnospira sp.]MCM1247254.1 aldo/keto reductase [Lachnoclostridium sp.]
MGKRWIALFTAAFFMTVFCACGKGDASDVSGAQGASGVPDALVTQGALADSAADEISVSQEPAQNTDKADIPKEADVSSFDLASGTNGNAPTVLLNSGYEMPIAGIGTYSLLEEECADSIVSALESGVRLIDTAYMYHNEESVGEGIRKSGVPREEIFVITKLYPSQYTDAENAIDMALEKLGMDYIDMMLLHHPGAGDVEAYKAMEQAVADGKIRSLGLSNWYIEEMENFLPQISIMPALVQNEIHPYYQEKEVIPYMHEQGIVVQAWYPLGGRGYTKELLSNETIVKIAEAHGVSAAQVILRWDLQNGVVVIPGSSNPEHIMENISLFDFELTEEEMGEMAALDRNEKHDWY